MSEKIKGMFGSETRADEVLAWLKSQGAENHAFYGNEEDSIYFVDQGRVRVVDESISVLFDIVELPRWRAISPGLYFYVSDRGCVGSTFDTDSAGQERFECGNYFKTKEEAEKYAEKFREILKRKKEG